LRTVVRSVSCALPPTRLLAGQLQHLATQRDDQSALLGDGDENGRRQNCPVALGNAGERLNSGYAAGDDVHDGLVVGHDPVFIQRRLKCLLSRTALLDQSRKSGVEGLTSPATERFRLIHGHVGLMQENLGRASTSL
jgi:hypothetical protein